MVRDNQSLSHTLNNDNMTLDNISMAFDNMTNPHREYQTEMTHDLGSIQEEDHMI
jgi:hypothetical protein